MKSIHKDIVRCFPKIDHAFSYGSGVFWQPGLYSRHVAGPMLDFVFGVNDPVSWHKENIDRNPAHYSFVSTFGADTVNFVAEKVGAGVYYNTLVPFQDQVIKYGVVNIRTFRKDLLDWNSLYLAGRLHKPVHMFLTSSQIMEAQRGNLENAFRAALLLCPKYFTMSQLLKVICSLSYIGDIRLGFAEDSAKVERIVKGSYEELCKLYQGSIDGALESNLVDTMPSHSPAQVEFRKTLSISDRATLYAFLPSSVLKTMMTFRRGDRLPRIPRRLIDAGDIEARMKLGHRLAASPYGDLALQRAIAFLVRSSSFKQACCGLLSGGPLKSTKYLWSKMKKYWKFS